MIQLLISTSTNGHRTLAKHSEVFWGLGCAEGGTQACVNPLPQPRHSQEFQLSDKQLHLQVCL